MLSSRYKFKSLKNPTMCNCLFHFFNNNCEFQPKEQSSVPATHNNSGAPTHAVSIFGKIILIQSSDQLWSEISLEAMSRIFWY